MISRKNKRITIKFMNKKAQIRGIDFALALLIFVIAFSQVIVVLSNLLIPSLVQMETYSQEQELNKLYSNIFYSEGTPTNWGTIASDSLVDYQLGLLGSNNELDFTKINRLTSDLSSYWKINYLDAKVSYGLVHDFAVSIYSQISIEIESFTAAFGDITLNGAVYEYQTAVNDAIIWAYAIDEDNNVVTNQTTTKDIGGSYSFQATLNAAETDHYTIVVFAQVGGIYQDYITFRLTREIVGLDYQISEFDFRPFVTENKGLSSTTVDVITERSSLSDTATAIVVFPFSGLYVSHFEQVLTPDATAEGDIYTGEGIPIPSSGVAVLIVQERAGTTYSAGYMGVPMFLDEDNGGIFAHTSFADQSSFNSKTQMFLVRNILVKCQIWYW